MKQLSNGSKYILEINVPGKLEYELTGKTTMLKRYRLSKPTLTEEDKEAINLFRAFWNNLHPTDDDFIYSFSESDSSGNVTTLKIKVITNRGSYFTGNCKP